MRTTIGIALAAASALTLSGCASGTTAAPTDGPVPVVASTDVYGQIAEAVGGDDVAVTSLIDSAAQDPHSFEPSAQDTLAVSDAALVVQNGGGYDPFVASLLDSSGSSATVITAVEYSDAWVAAGGSPAGASDAPHGGDAAIEGFNEHVWYDPSTVGEVAAAIADDLTELRPADAAAFAANLATFQDGLAGLEASLAAMRPADSGDEIFVTEPVPLYLTAAAGLVNVAPDAFTEAVEEGQDVPPATLLESLTLVGSGDVRLVIVNAQTAGAESGRVADAAEAAGVPVVQVTETLPEGKTYLEWMTDNATEIADALTP